MRVRLEKVQICAGDICGEFLHKEIESVYAESSRNFFTLCIVTNAVGEDEIMMIGWLWPDVC